MLVTTGLGILVPILAVAFPLLTRYLANNFTGSPTYYQDHPYLFYYALCIAAFLCWWIGRTMNQRYEERNPSDPDEGVGRKIFRNLGKHTVFFLPMEQFAILIPVIGYLVKSQFGIY